MFSLPKCRLSLRLLGVVIATLAHGAMPASAQVEITEIMAVADEDFRDEDGAPSDWIEITNFGLEEVSLDGTYLTNSRNDLTRWAFPDVGVAAGSAIVIFASGKDRTRGDELHTNFNLERGGDYLALVASNGSTVMSEFSPGYPEQLEGISYGRTRDSLPADPSFGFFKVPTPGERNGPSSAPPPADVEFSESSRMFTRAFRLVLSCPTPGAVIRYTTDMSVPTARSAEYTSMIPVAANRQIRARAFLPGAIDGAVTTHSYLKMAEDVPAFSSNLPIIVVSTLDGGPPPSTSSTGRKTAFMFFFEPDPESGATTLTQLPALTTRAGIRRRGSSSGGWPKYSLSVETWQDGNDDDRNLRPLGMAREADWILNARYEWDLTLMRNPFVYEISRQIGRYAPRTRFVEVFSDTSGGEVVDLDYFGVYSLIERIEVDPNRVAIERLDRWENREPEITGGYIFKNDRPDPGEPTLSVGGMGQITAVDPDGLELSSQQRSWITRYLNELNSALINRPSGINRTTGLHFTDYIEVGSWIDHHLLNTLVMNIDWGRHSAFFYKDRGGKVVSGPVWDYDRSLGCEDVRDDNPLAWSGVVNSVGTVSSRTWYDTRFPWYGNLLGPTEDPAEANYPEVRQQHTDRWFELRQDQFSTANLHAVIDGMAAEIREAQERNFERWTQHPPDGGNFAAPGLTGWEAEISHMKRWLVARAAWIDEQYLTPPLFNAVGGAVDRGFPLVLGSPDARVYYTRDGTDPRAQGGEASPQAASFAGRVVREKVLDEDSPCRYHVPASGILGQDWTAEPGQFDDSSWAEGRGGVGFESNDTISDLIATDIGGVMHGVNGGCYIRYRFDHEHADRIASVSLTLHADDGFVVFLNGVEVGSLLKPPSLEWNSTTMDGLGRPGGDVAVVHSPLTLDLSRFRGLIRDGANVLAVHGLNAGADDADFLIKPELVIDRLSASVPIEIEETQTITARTFDGAVWSAPSRVTLVVSEEPASGSNLVISELMYHPAAPSEDEVAAGYSDADQFEFVELLNIGQETVSFAGLRFTNGVAFDFADASASELVPGERVLVVRDRAAFEHRYGSDALSRVVGEFAHETGLSNEGERLTLTGFNGEEIRTFRYDDRAPWSRLADGGGHSLVLVNAMMNPDHDAPHNWRSSALVDGSPGGTLGETYALWAARFGNPFPGSDADQDGRVALLEFVRGDDPTVVEGDPGIVRMERDEVSGDVLVSFRRNLQAEDVVIVLESSSDLQTWQHGGADWEFVAEELIGRGVARQTYRLRAGSEARYVRQRIELP